jgi:hypothetical protein
MLEHGLARDWQLGRQLGGGRGRMPGDRREQRAAGGIRQRAKHRAGAILGFAAAHLATSAGP